MYLGTALARLEDLDNGRAAYARALALSPGEPLVHINHGEGGVGGGGAV